MCVLDEARSAPCMDERQSIRIALAWGPGYMVGLASSAQATWRQSAVTGSGQAAKSPWNATLGYDKNVPTCCHEERAETLLLYVGHCQARPSARSCKWPSWRGSRELYMFPRGERCWIEIVVTRIDAKGQCAPPKPQIDPSRPERRTGDDASVRG